MKIYKKTNRFAHRNYRERLQHLKSLVDDEGRYRAFYPGFLFSALVSAWSAMYADRMQAMFRWTLDNLDAELRDDIALYLLKRRNQRDNREFTTIPFFTEEEITRFDQVSMPKLCIDVKSFAEVPAYGKSFQRVLSNIVSEGYGPEEPNRLLNRLVDTIVTPAPVWARDDERRAAGLPEVEPEVTRRLAITAKWQQTPSLEIPWEARVEDEKWEVRLNDFPDEWMYSLIVNGVVLGDFHDWPRNWDRGEEYWPEEPVPRKKVKTSRTVKASAETWMSRYEAGQCVAVWSEMVSLGGRRP